MRLTSDAAFDPGTLYVESWATSPVADWDYYRFVIQSGVAQVQGYGSSGFVDISTPTLSYPDATTVELDVTVGDLGLALDRMDIGFASGWCGPDEYWCDHYPDGWGYPYTGWSPSLWFSLEW
jgi:hypothetical protein